jgi:hypothetical protein
VLEKGEKQKNILPRKVKSVREKEPEKAVSTLICMIPDAASKTLSGRSRSEATVVFGLDTKGLIFSQGGSEWPRRNEILESLCQKRLNRDWLKVPGEEDRPGNISLLKVKKGSVKEHAGVEKPESILLPKARRDK